MTTQSLLTIEKDIVERMFKRIHCQKPEVIQDAFGIGINTWVKIREGKAIRRSVAIRLLERLKREQVV